LLKHIASSRWDVGPDIQQMPLEAYIDVLEKMKKDGISKIMNGKCELIPKG
jgi:hypothetical protein